MSIRRRLLSGLANLALLVLTLLVGLGVGEGLVRWLRPQQLRRTQNLYDPTDSIGYVQRPNLRVTINTGERPVEIITDHDGYRVGPEGRVEADRRVLIIGDSYMQAIEVPYAESLAGLLQASLPARLGQAVAVRDGGVSGYGPSHYRIAAERALGRERFDAMLVAVYVGNDLVATRVASFPPIERSPPLRPRRPRSWSFQEFNRAVTTPLMLLSLRRSHLAVLAWNASDLLRARLGMAEYGFPPTLLASRAAGEEWDVTAALCAEMAQAGVRQGAAVVFVVIPQFLQMAPEIGAAHARAFGLSPEQVVLDQPNTLLVDRMREKGLDVIDALPALRGRHAAGVLMFGRSDRHLSPEGHKVLQQLVEPWLLERLARPRPTGAARNAADAR